jgi:hypothetical protein
MWEEYEASKMDVVDGSVWYLIEKEWFNKWKDYVGFDDTSDSRHPGDINNSYLLNSDKSVLWHKSELNFKYWLNANLKDNLKEDIDYVIMNPAIWDYLHQMYGGVTIKRYGTLIDVNTEECIIEVNLQKLYVFDVPKDPH